MRADSRGRGGRQEGQGKFLGAFCAAQLRLRLDIGGSFDVLNNAKPDWQSV